MKIEKGKIVSATEDEIFFFVSQKRNGRNYAV